MKFHACQAAPPRRRHPNRSLRAHDNNCALAKTPLRVVRAESTPRPPSLALLVTRFLPTAFLAFLPSFALAQGAPTQQSGEITPGHPSMWLTNAYGGASQTALQLYINGQLYAFQTSGVFGPSTGVVPSYIPLWNSSPRGTLLQAGVPTGQVSASAGAVIDRGGDRLFVGKNTNANDGNLPALAKDWLETIFPNSTARATIAALGQKGGIGVLGSVRTSDGASGDYSSGLMGACINDYPAGTNTSCTSGYFETQHTTTAKRTNYSHGIEIDIDEMNSGAGYPIHYQPYTAPFPGGLTSALWLASGGVRPGAQTATAAIGIIANGANFRSGIVFQQNSIYGTGGLGGQGEAIAMARGHEINWYTPDGNINTSLVGIGDTGQPTAFVYLGGGGMSVTSSAAATFTLASAAGANAARVLFMNGSTAKYSIGLDGTGNNFVLRDDKTSTDILTIVRRNLTLGDPAGTITLNSATQFGSSASWNPNGNVATTMTSLGPARAHETVQEWLTITNSAGVVRYVPAY